MHQINNCCKPFQINSILIIGNLEKCLLHYKLYVKTFNIIKDFNYRYFIIRWKSLIMILIIIGVNLIKISHMLPFTDMSWRGRSDEETPL